MKLDRYNAVQFIFLGVQFSTLGLRLTGIIEKTLLTDAIFWGSLFVVIGIGFGRRRKRKAGL